MRALVWFVVVAGYQVCAHVASAQETCPEQRATLAEAVTALKGCIDNGLGECDIEQASLEAAKDALERCEGGESATPRAPATTGVTAEPDATAIPTPAPTEPAGKIGLLFDGISGTAHEEALAGARLGLAGADLVDGGAIRAARAFLPAATLDDAALAKLRSDIGAERLLAFQVKVEGATRFLSLRIVDPGAVAQRFGEATEKTLGDEVRRMVSELPPVARVEVATPVPTATPHPVVIMTPTPAPSPVPGQEYAASRPYVDVNVSAGSKILAESDWAPLANQTELGLMGTVGGTGWPVLIASDALYSFASGRTNGVDVRAQTFETCIGLRGIFDLGTFRPHLGAGLVYATVATTARFDDGNEFAAGSGTGFWVGGGALLRLGRSANLGLQMRFSSVTARIPVYGTEQSAGGFHIGATAGFGFGSASKPRPTGDPADH